LQSSTIANAVLLAHETDSSVGRSILTLLNDTQRWMHRVVQKIDFLDLELIRLT
jgi:hypothetical protein